MSREKCHPPLSLGRREGRFDGRITERPLRRSRVPGRGRSGPGTIRSSLSCFTVNLLLVPPCRQWEPRPGNLDNTEYRGLCGLSPYQWKGVWRSIPNNSNRDRDFSIQTVTAANIKLLACCWRPEKPGLSQGLPVGYPLPSLISDQCDSRNYLHFLPPVSIFRTRRTTHLVTLPARRFHFS